MGGSESCINPTSLGGFYAARALCTNYSDTPELASRPFDASKSGFVMSEGAARAMQMALKQSSLAANAIDYINVHSTSTVIGDNAEIAAIKSIFGDCNPYISSKKSSTGHLLGAAGAVASIFAINHSLLPPSLNIDKLDDSAQALNIIKNQSLSQPISAALVNGFGFGGVNSSIVFNKFSE